MVEREIVLDYPALLGRPLIERDITLTCVSNEVGGTLVGTARWLGAPLTDLLAEAGVRPGADQLLGTSADGMTIGTPTAVVMDGRDAMLAVGMNGEPLPLEHGFPVRMVVPGLYGYVSAHQVAARPRADQVRRRRRRTGSSVVGRRRRRSRPRRGSTRRDRSASWRPGRVAVAGVAWAQHRGVDKVEVRVDDGAWHPARLAAVPSVAPGAGQWVWVYSGTQLPGSHTLKVRATDRADDAAREADQPFPSGSTGWHSIVVTVT